LVQHLRPGGHYLQYGAASGTPADLPSLDLGSRGVTVSTLAGLIDGPADNAALVDRALALTTQGRMSPAIGQTYPLAQAATPHADIAARRTIGKTLLLP
jgi:NADPH:quinone reductase